MPKQKIEEPILKPAPAPAEDPAWGKLTAGWNINQQPPGEAAGQAWDIADYEKNLQEKARQGPGDFLNVGRLMDANKGQGQRMATALAGDVGGRAQGVKDQIGAGSSQMTAGANVGGAGTYTYARGTYDGRDTSGLRSGTGLSTGRAGVIEGGSDANGLVGPASGDYSGPESLDAMDPSLRGKAKTADAEAANLTNETGRMSSLRDLYGKGTGYYGSGGAGFDSFLTGAEGQGTLEGAAQEFGGLEDTFNVANKKSEDEVDLRHLMDEKVKGAAAAKIEREKAAKAAGPTFTKADQDAFFAGYAADIAALDRDTETDDWMAKINDKARLSGGPSAYTAEKTGDWSKWAAWLEKTRGPGAWAEWKNAYDDKVNRQARRRAFIEKARSVGVTSAPKERLSWFENLFHSQMGNVMAQGGNPGYGTDGTVDNHRRTLYVEPKYR